jgi:hypothetical protein
MKWVSFKCWSLKGSSLLFLMNARWLWRGDFNEGAAQELVLNWHWRPHIWRWNFSSKWQWLKRRWEERDRLQTLDWHYTISTFCTCEMYLFLSVIVQMCHDQRDRLKDYWSTLEQFFMVFYGNTMKWDRFFHILRFLLFSDNRNEPDKTGENYDKFSNSTYQRNTNSLG